MEELTLDTESGSINVDFARKLIRFNFWENQRVWDLAIAPLTEDQFLREVKFLRGSVQSECQRIISTESAYLRRILGASIVAGESVEDRMDRAAIAARWMSLRRAWTEFAQELDGDLFFSTCEVETDGGRREMQVWQLVFHVLYHSTSRRSQILRLVAEVNKPAAFDLSLLQHLTGLLRG
ncbi:MAG: DinB family protein [Chloroflexi bacterium]|nr:DinB family protein [Chloroflexota bacterium]